MEIVYHALDLHRLSALLVQVQIIYSLLQRLVKALVQPVIVLVQQEIFVKLRDIVIHLVVLAT